MSTLYIPSGSKTVGESYPNIIGTGSFFSDISKPRPVTGVGTTHERGSIEWSDIIVSTQGATAGAILVEFSLASSSAPSGIGMSMLESVDLLAAVSIHIQFSKKTSPTNRD